MAVQSVDARQSVKTLLRLIVISRASDVCLQYTEAAVTCLPTKDFDGLRSYIRSYIYWQQ
jgi:hypothetical protein